MDLNVEIIAKKYKKLDQPKEIKGYTINDESRYLLIQNVPKINVVGELIELFKQYGEIENWCKIEGLTNEEPFTESFWFKYASFEQARMAKSKLDDAIFFSKPLWVSYAPQYESTEDTKVKLLDRINKVRTSSSSNQPMTLFK